MKLRQYSARVFGWLLLLLLATSPALAERRVALVIGNDAYTHLPKLNNARKDAEGMAAKLQELGFETILKVNASERDMARALRDFEGRLSSGAVGLAFFAGHGIQADGKNYLIPANADIEVEADLSVEALTAQDILASMERAGNPLNILILDACRDNPLPKRSRSAKRGLTVVGIPSGAKGTAILYSAGEGQTAEDGPPGGHGVFTGELLKVMDQPGLTLEQVFKRVNRRVQERTGSRQRPWNLVSLQGDFVFRAVELSAQPAASNTQPAADACAPAERAWQYVEKSQRAADFEAFIKRYPSCFLADLARTRLDELKRGTQVASVAPTAPSPELEVTSLDQTMVVSGAARLNIRKIPGGPKVGGFKSGDKVEVTGKAQHEGALWYRVAVAGGNAGFVFGKYLSDKPLTAVKPVVGIYPKATALAPGAVFQDCSGCPEMVVVPPGEFMMGSTDAEGDWFLKQGGKQEWLDRERPRHRVSIGQSFAAGKTEVTVGQYRRFAAATSRPDGDGCYVYGEFDGKWQWKKQADRNWRKPGYPQTDTHPVTCVSWGDAAAYVKWLSGHTGEAYRLLTEAEWEYAARGGTTTMRYWGHDWDNKAGCTYANVGNKEHWTTGFDCKDGYKHTSPVGTHKANAFGLDDTLGNVWEWVEDCFEDNYTGARSDGSAWPSGDCSDRVLRGGSWYGIPRNLRSAFRVRLRTGIRSSDDGFRVARTLP